jgi:hypothetical protein
LWGNSWFIADRKIIVPAVFQRDFLDGVAQFPIRHRRQARSYSFYRHGDQA